MGSEASFILWATLASHIRVVNGNGLWEIRGITSIGVLLQHYCVTAAWRLDLEGTDVTFGTGVAFTA